MKCGWIHVFRLKTGEVREGQLMYKFRGVTFWRALHFTSADPCPHVVAEDAIEWAHPIIELRPNTTECDYHDTLTEMSEK